MKHFWRPAFIAGLAVGSAALATILLGSNPAEACADFAQAPSSHWSLTADHGVDHLVTPCGEHFFSLGVNVLDSEIPKAAIPGHERYDWHRFYASPEAWAEDTRRRVAQWGFNSAGAWSAPDSLLRLPFIANLELGRNARFHWFDPFDPVTETVMRQRAVELVAPYKGDPRRIGYFADNEVGWWGGALFFFYSAEPATNYTKQRWVGMLRDQYAEDWRRFAADFQPPSGVDSWDALLRSRDFTHLRPGGGGIQAVRRWTGIIAERYYSLIEASLRYADPDALIFSDRLPIYYDPIAVRAMARHVDVVAVNYNLDSPDGWVAPYFFDGLRALTGGKPVLVSEWFFAAAENRTGNRNNGHLMTVETQAERAEGAAAATTNFAAIPEIVGAQWFQFADHPRGGRADGEDYDFGLVDVDNQPYGRLTQALASANRNAASLHAAAAIARPHLPADRRLVLPEAAVNSKAHSLLDWPKAAALVPLVPNRGEVAFGETYLAWDETGIHVATIGQDYFDIDLLAYDGAFPLGEAYHLDIGLDAGTGPRRFGLYFIPPRTKLKDHPPMQALLCAGAAPTASSCTAVPQGIASYFGADQPRITAEAFLPWSALGRTAPPADGSIKVELAATAWHRSRWMSLSGLAPEEAMAQPQRWATARLGLPATAETEETHLRVPVGDPDAVRSGLVPALPAATLLPF